MTNELQDTLNQALQDKTTNLLPENLKAGVTCLGVEGRMQSGVDTSDATAVANDIVADKTAYVNEEKLTGTILEARNSSTGFNLTGVETREGYNYLYVKGHGHDMSGSGYNGGKGYSGYVIGPNTDITQSVPYSDVAEAVGLTADKLKAGETILGVGGTYKKVDLNVYSQLEEPENKTGLWLKQDKPYSNSIDTYISDYILKNTSFTISDCAVTNVGNVIYFFCGNSSFQRAGYKYDITTGEFTTITTPPSAYHGGSVAVTVGTDIYIFGGSWGTSTKAHKYNTLTDSYTQLKTMPKTCVDAIGISVGTDIYLFGAWGGAYAYKYDTLTDSYTQLATPPIEPNSSMKVMLNGIIYLIDASSSTKGFWLYKYNIESNSYTRAKNLPQYLMSGTVAQYGEDMYVIGGYHYENKIYKYNLITETSEYLKDMPYAVGDRQAVVIDDNIYFINTVDGAIKLETINIKGANKMYQSNGIVVDQSEPTYSTTLMLNDVETAFQFKDFWYYEDTLQIDGYEKYYGNGTDWIQI